MPLRPLGGFLELWKALGSAFVAPAWLKDGSCGRLGGLLAASWAHLKPSLTILGRLGGVLAVWAASWPPLGRLLARLGCRLWRLGRVLTRLGLILERLGVVLERLKKSRSVLGAF